MRTEKRQRQLEKMWVASKTDDARKKQGASMSRVMNENVELKARCLAAIHSPEARKKAAASATKPLADRFHAKIEKADDGCWNWTGYRTPQGYGKINLGAPDRKIVRATHVALEISGRPRPSPDLLALHSCDNPSCCNPDHLRWGTYADNHEDMRSRNRANMSGLKGVASGGVFLSRQGGD